MHPQNPNQNYNPPLIWDIDCATNQLIWTRLAVKIIGGILCLILSYFLCVLPIVLGLFVCFYTCVTALLILSFGGELLPRITFIPIFLALLGALPMLTGYPLNEEFYFMQSSHALLNSKERVEFPCFQNMSFYEKVAKEILTKNMYSHALFGPKGSGKSTFLSLYTQNNIGVYY